MVLVEVNVEGSARAATCRMQTELAEAASGKVLSIPGQSAMVVTGELQNALEEGCQHSRVLLGKMGRTKLGYGACRHTPPC